MNECADFLLILTESLFSFVVRSNNLKCEYIYEGNANRTCNVFSKRAQAEEIAGSTVEIGNSECAKTYALLLRIRRRHNAA